ncbi:MAG TPA: hypothetical protein VGF29_17555 [Hyphomicrobiaceae bacterium]|jgi:hypothetical protein
MARPLCISDPEIDASVSHIASAVLEHPLARRLDWQAVWVLMAIASGDPSVRPDDARAVLRLALAAIDAAEIALGMEIRP